MIGLFLLNIQNFYKTYIDQEKSSHLLVVIYIENQSCRLHFLENMSYLQVTVYPIKHAVYERRGQENAKIIKEKT